MNHRLEARNQRGVLFASQYVGRNIGGIAGLSHYRVARIQFSWGYPFFQDLQPDLVGYFFRGGRRQGAENGNVDIPPNQTALVRVIDRE